MSLGSFSAPENEYIKGSFSSRRRNEHKNIQAVSRLTKSIRESAVSATTCLSLSCVGEI